MCFLGQCLFPQSSSRHSWHPLNSTRHWTEAATEGRHSQLRKSRVVSQCSSSRTDSDAHKHKIINLLHQLMSFDVGVVGKWWPIDADKKTRRFSFAFRYSVYFTVVYPFISTDVVDQVNDRTRCKQRCVEKAASASRYWCESFVIFTFSAGNWGVVRYACKCTAYGIISMRLQTELSRQQATSHSRSVPCAHSYLRIANIRMILFTLEIL